MWELATVANAVIAVSYLAIAALILRGLRQTKQVRTNALGAATGVIFFSCGIGHAIHVVMLAQSAPHTGMAHMSMGSGVPWWMASWDVVTACAALVYLKLRHSYGTLLRTPMMFEDEVRRETDRRVRALLEGLAEGVTLVDADGTLTHENPAAHELARLFGSIPPAELPWDVTRRTGAPQVDVEVEVVGDDGQPRWVELNTRRLPGSTDLPCPVVVSYSDVTAQREWAEQLQRLADHDPLTGLLNRRGFGEVLERHVSDVARYGPRGALLVVDLDGFKAVNDTLGHKAGDEVMVDVARCLRGRLRAGDAIGRLGGDEFAVLIAQGGAAEAEQVGAGIVRAIRDGRESDGAAQITASVGVAVIDRTVPTADAALACADAAMYSAKVQGRDRWSIAAVDDPARVLVD